MLFDSVQYAIFLPCVLSLYYILNARLQNYWLLIASYTFYGWWDHRFLLLIIASTFIDYLCGIKIEEKRGSLVSRLFLTASITSNLGMLFTFKYFDFFIESASTLLTAIGFETNSRTLNILLPVGISFYTFQTMSYSIDVFKGRIQACRSLINFSLFVCYFPQLVAGPIERASNLLPAIESKRTVNKNDVSEGALLILLGLFKKIGVANALAFSVDTVFRNPNEFSGYTLLIGVYLFAIQIYCDFSGYSDIARGTSRLIGINLMENFDQPYFSMSLTEFWRRWHISLSQWLRDYLYIPLGGNRKGPARTYANLLITMVLGGLWHGASWTFIVWGSLHGLFLSIEKFLGVNGSRKTSVTERLIRCLILFQFLCLTWLFFRAETIHGSWLMLTKILTWAPGSDWISKWDTLRFLILASTVLILDIVQFRSCSHVGLLSAKPVSLSFTLATIMIMTLTLGGMAGEVPFIYFQF